MRGLLALLGAFVTIKIEFRSAIIHIPESVKLFVHFVNF